MATNQVKGPLNPAHIDSVTRADHDHRILWTTTNSVLQQHKVLIAQLQVQIAALQAKVK